MHVHRVRQVLELNASDTRNKREIEALLSDAVSSQAISAGGEVVNRKRLVIMDEVDGMGGSDRGGIAELIKVRWNLYLYIKTVAVLMRV